MKKLLLIFSLLFFTFSINAQKLSSPIYLINFLNDCCDENDLKQVLRDYGFSELPTDGEYINWMYPDGTLFSCKMDNVNNKLKAPEIRIKTKENKKKSDRILKDIGFKKESGKYVKGNRHAQSISIVTPISTGLICERIYQGTSGN